VALHPSIYGQLGVPKTKRLEPSFGIGLSQKVCDQILILDTLCWSLSLWLSSLCMKQGTLFCFVVLRWDLPNHGASRCALVSSKKSFWWVGVHWLVLRLFRATVWRKLLIIESFSQWKLNKIETENCIGIWGGSWCC
jgi:hypothetical protein